MSYHMSQILVSSREFNHRILSVRLGFHFTPARNGCTELDSHMWHNFFLCVVHGIESFNTNWNLILTLIAPSKNSNFCLNTELSGARYGLCAPEVPKQNDPDSKPHPIAWEGDEELGPRPRRGWDSICRRRTFG